MTSHVSEFGMAAISYHWSWSAVIASIQDTDEIASLSNVSSTLATIAVVHQTPENATQRLLRGTWWKPTKESDYVLFLGNTSLRAKDVQVRVSDHLGNLITQKVVRLASHCSALLHASDLLIGQTTAENVGDVSILYRGPQNGIVASASIEDETIGYSATPHLVEELPNDNEPAKSVTLHAPGLMVGKADPEMLFPQGTFFTPYGILHNVSARPLTVKVSFTADIPEGQPTTRLLDQLSLAAGQSLELGLSQYFGPSTPLPNGYGHLSVAFVGKYEDLIFDAGSADQTGNYVFQVMPSAEAPTTSKIFCYWSMDGDTSTMMSIWNYSNNPQDMTLMLYYSGGHYRIPIHLAARQSYNLDMMMLVDSRVADPVGNLIPANITSGSARLTGPGGGDLDTMNVVVSASAYNVRNGTCWPVCTNCGGLTSVYIDPNTTVIPILSWTQAGGMYTSSSGGPYSIGGGGSWSSQNTSIANVNSVGNVYGQGPGTTSLLVQMSSPPGTVQCYYSAASMCAYQSFEGTGGAAVTPVIASITPSIILTDENTIVTIVGNGFGSSPSITIPGIGATIQSASNTSITATLSVPVTEPFGYEPVTVTASGQQSNQYWIEMDGPYQMVVAGETDNNIQANLYRGIIYQIMNYSGVTAQSVNICEIPSLSAWSCNQAPPPRHSRHVHRTPTLGQMVNSLTDGRWGMQLIRRPAAGITSQMFGTGDTLRRHRTSAG